MFFTKFVLPFHIAGYLLLFGLMIAICSICGADISIYLKIFANTTAIFAIAMGSKGFSQAPHELSNYKPIFQRFSWDQNFRHFLFLGSLILFFGAIESKSYPLITGEILIIFGTFMGLIMSYRKDVKQMRKVMNAVSAIIFVFAFLFLFYGFAKDLFPEISLIFTYFGFCILAFFFSRAHRMFVIKTEGKNQSLVFSSENARFYYAMTILGAVFLCLGNFLVIKQLVWQNQNLLSQFSLMIISFFVLNAYFAVSDYFSRRSLV